MGIQYELFESILEKMKEYYGVQYDFEIGENMEQVAKIFLSMVENITERRFPQEPLFQLYLFSLLFCEFP